MDNGPREPATAELTHWLDAWSQGDADAFDRASDLLYAELRWLARSHLRKEFAAPLDSVELIHEAFLRLTRQRHVQWQNRRHFFGVASQMMRRILVDQARAANQAKRGGGVRPIPLDDAPTLSAGASSEILSVHEGLEDLARLDPLRAQIVEMRFFAGFEMEEIAEALDLSVSSVYRRWRLARAWLHRHLNAT
ncbi:MAG: ECF-type sigma factor [Acidobacteriota bacterium]